LEIGRSPEEFADVEKTASWGTSIARRPTWVFLGGSIVDTQTATTAFAALTPERQMRFLATLGA